MTSSPGPTGSRARVKMTHRNYHEISGDTPHACGHELGRLFGPIVRDYIADAREDGAWQARRRQAQPLLAQTAKFFPAYVEELEAYASAAGLPLIDLWTLSIEDELDDDGCERCTTIVTNNGRLIGHNEDWDPDAADDICILKKRCAGVTTLELYYYGCPLGGVALSVSSRGLAQAINSLDHTDWQVGVPKLVLARRLSEIRNVDAELGGLLAVPRSSGFAHNLIDRSGRVTLVECTATRHSVHYRDNPSVHTNHMLCPELGRFQGHHEGKSTLRRYGSACDLVRPMMDPQDMSKLLSDQSRGSNSSVFNRNTIARAIVDLDRRTASFWLRRESRKGWIDYSIDFFADAAEASV